VTKVKYILSGTHRETPLNIDFGIKNERQDCKIGTVCVCVWRVICKRGWVNWEDEGERI
jgi:hypothetical protein